MPVTVDVLPDIRPSCVSAAVPLAVLFPLELEPDAVSEGAFPIRSVALLSGVMESVCPFIEVPSEKSDSEAIWVCGGTVSVAVFLPHAAANSKIVVKRMGLAKESFFIISLISAHIFCACRVCVKCAQTQSSRLKNFIFQSLYLRFFIMCRKK